MFIAYVYIGLGRTDRCSCRGSMLPHHISLGERVRDTAGDPVSLVYAAILGLVMYGLIYRPLRAARR